MTLDIMRERAQRVIDRAGAKWAGIMDTGERRLVLFTSKRTGSTLALDVRDVVSDQGEEMIRTHLAESDQRFGLS